MGNKSNQQKRTKITRAMAARAKSTPESLHPMAKKWRAQRNMVGAQQPRATSGVPVKAQWGGKRPKALSPKARVTVPGSPTPLRRVPMRTALPVLWDSARRGTFKAAP